MELQALIDGLRTSPTFGTTESVTVHQTHISVVFVGDERAYKLKKPVDLGFIDYSTPERRRHFCEQEVRLNRRLAPDVYLGVLAVVSDDGGLRLTDPDDPRAIDWVVEMRRLEDSDTFLSHLHRDTLEPAWLEQLGERMAAFHDSCARGKHGDHGSFANVSRNALDNFTQAASQRGVTVDATVFDAAQAANTDLLKQLEALVTARDAAGCTRDTHGDLRLEHVYWNEGKLCVVDCIEFNEAFRYADPVADIAFLVMDLRLRWADELARRFTDAYFAERPGGEELLEFYVAYRSAVRAKVHGIAVLEPELDERTRERSRAKSRAHWLFTWSVLAAPAERPALVIVGGLPGTGKSTLARHLAAEHGFELIDSDHVRKELAGVPPSESMRAEMNEGIYTPEWTARTYGECLERATSIVHAGGRAVVSASFVRDAHRSQFLEMAHAAGVRGLMLECVLDADEVRRRIAARRGDASDADLETYDHLAAAWEAPSGFVASVLEQIPTSNHRETTEHVQEVLHRAGLFGER